MAEPVLFVSRILRLPLLDVDGETIGRVGDLVLGPAVRDQGPLLLGLVAVVNRRRIFVAATRVADIAASGVRLRTQAVDLKPFRPRAAELLATRLLDHPAPGGQVVVDVGLAPSTGPARSWHATVVALGRAGALRRAKPSRVVPWNEIPGLFDTGDVGREVETLRALHPSDRARAVTKLTPDRRSELAAALADEDLADMLEELPESEQVRIITELATARAAHVLEEMEPDDAADLLAELTREHRSRLLEAMLPEEADPLRRLLVFDDHSAGGLMTPEPLVLPPEATVAEALARLRAEDVPAAIATSVFVVQPPTQTPTGPYLGMVTFQRLLREAPGELLGRVADGTPVAIAPDLAEIEVAARLAAYDLLALPVCDADGRLLGAVTVDDVLDRTLPVGWRSR
ncbi:MAG TPA: CBS domain-containing protein [Acidimicrobiales bacterium]|jgi:CBS domain-containing protein|nr:CBS domain-containing protein [Acidimicrobiales bacterium]